MTGPSDDLWQFREKVILRKDSIPFLEACQLTTVEGADKFALGEELRRYPEKSIVQFMKNEKTYFLKRYHYSRLSVFIRAALKWNFPVLSGVTEWQRLNQLDALGFRVPKAVAAGLGGSLFRGLSFIVLEELPGRSLESQLQEASPCFTLRRQRRIARALGQWIRRFHDAGFCHKDLYLCHIFMTNDDVLGLLDCERICHWPGQVPERWIVKDLAALLYSSTGLVPNTVRHSFLAGYWPAKAELRNAVPKLRAIARKAKILARKGRKV
ncbi:MAG: lipopolysaccharide kinase InaA family protein [Planctomycetota bacterium]|nr:lipopolysaccharide kinase InaA family protein [Planctomycetota bacterium]